MRWLCVHMSISSLFDNLGFLQSLSFYCRVCSLFLPAVAFCRKKSGVREDDHIPGLRWVPGTATKCEFLASHRKLLKSQFSSVAQSCPTLRPHELQHTRPPCPSPTPRVHSNPCPLSQWCHPTILSSVAPFSYCPQSFPASESFQMNQFFASGGQSTGVSASTSVLPMNNQDWSLLGWTSWISLQSKGLSGVFSNTTVQKHQFFGAQLSL